MRLKRRFGFGNERLAFTLSHGLNDQGLIELQAADPHEDASP
jgi:hypothetical protein